MNPFLEVTLAVEGGREGSVVQRPRWHPLALVGWHPHDAILCLFWRKFSSQLVHQYIGLRWRKVNVRVYMNINSFAHR